jgi:hypothetical protein
VPNGFAPVRQVRISGETIPVEQAEALELLGPGGVQVEIRDFDGNRIFNSHGRIVVLDVEHRVLAVQVDIVALVDRPARLEVPEAPRSALRRNPNVDAYEHHRARGDGAHGGFSTKNRVGGGGTGALGRASRARLARRQASEPQP